VEKLFKKKTFKNIRYKKKLICIKNTYTKCINICNIVYFRKFEYIACPPRERNWAGTKIRLFLRILTTIPARALPIVRCRRRCCRCEIHHRSPRGGRILPQDGGPGSLPCASELRSLSGLGIVVWWKNASPYFCSHSQILSKHYNNRNIQRII